VLLDDAVRTLVALARGAVAETGGNGDGGGRHGTRR
jgi:hypothetical protein